MRSVYSFMSAPPFHTWPSRVGTSPSRTLRTSSPSSTVCVNGPSLSSLTSSGLITDSCSTKGTSRPRCGMMRSGLFRVAEFSVVMASRRISMSLSCSIVRSISTSTFRSMASKVSSLSGSEYRIACRAIPRMAGDGSERSVCIC